MKKIIRNSLFGLIYLLIVFILAIFFITTAKADLIKPNNNIEPYQVVKIQLRGLKENDSPIKDNGIVQTWELAHPNNQKNTGPLNKFIVMLKGDSYKMLLNHKEHQIIEVQLANSIASYEVTILDENKFYHRFIWQVEKYTKDDILKDC